MSEFGLGAIGLIRVRIKVRERAIDQRKRKLETLEKQLTELQTKLDADKAELAKLVQT